MIRNLADILRSFMEEESAKLAEFKVKHGPTIGDMYEGLSAEVLNRAIPTNLDLRVVNGFVVDPQGKMSGQMDCMLVRGAGERIPFTDSHKWPVWDVLAVLEVKKTLTYEDLKDSFVHLREVYDSYRAWLHSSNGNTKLDIESGLRAFARITGVHSKGKTDEVPPYLQLMHYTLIIEQLSPVRIVWGYGGYKTQTGLREAMLNFLGKATRDNGIGVGFGVPCFPQLISCNGISLVKGNGQPYMCQMQGELWPFLFSSVTNPVWIMLEFLWAKIENVYKLSMPWADGVVQEAFVPFLSAELVEPSGQAGWSYRVTDFKRLDNDPATTSEWRPVELSIEQYVVLNQLARFGSVDTTEKELIEWTEKAGQTMEVFIKRLQATGFAAFDGKLLHPTTDTVHLVITPDGRFLGASDSRQMMEYLDQPVRKRDTKST